MFPCQGVAGGGLDLSGSETMSTDSQQSHMEDMGAAGEDNNDAQWES